MNDDLVKRLKNVAVHSYLGRSVIEEAAHRLKALTAEREAFEQDNHRWKMECENFWRDREKDLTAECDKYEGAWLTAEGKLADVEAERDQWVAHAKNAVWTDSEELKLVEADNARLREALWAILACETPNANATVTRMAAITKAALKGEAK